MEQQTKKRGRPAKASKENEPLEAVEQTANMEPLVAKPKANATRKKPVIKDAVDDAVKPEEPATEQIVANGVEEKPAAKTGGRAKKEKVTKAEVVKEPKVKRVAEKKPKGKGKATEDAAEEVEQPPAVLQEVPLAEVEKKVLGKSAKSAKAPAVAKESKTVSAKNEKNTKPAPDTNTDSPKKVEKKATVAKRGKNAKEKSTEAAVATEEKVVDEDTNIPEVTTKKGRGKAKAIPEIKANDQLVTKRKPKGKDVSPMATAEANETPAPPAGEPTEPVKPIALTKTVAKLTGRGKKKAEPEANGDGMSTIPN